MLDPNINLCFSAVLLQHLLDLFNADHREQDNLLVELTVHIVELEFLGVLEILNNDHYYEIGQPVAEVQICKRHLHRDEIGLSVNDTLGTPQSYELLFPVASKGDSELLLLFELR